MVGKLCCCAFTITACYSYYPAVAFVPVAKFYFAAHLYSHRTYLLHYFRFLTYTGAFHYTVCIQYFFYRMHTFFYRYAILLQYFFKVFLYSPTITHKHIPPLLLSQQGCAYTAFSGAEYYQALCVCLCAHYCSFNVTMLIIASSIPMIQKRVTIFDS